MQLHRCFASTAHVLPAAHDSSRPLAPVGLLLSGNHSTIGASVLRAGARYDPTASAVCFVLAARLGKYRQRYDLLHSFGRGGSV